MSECTSSWTQLQAAEADKAKSPPPSAVTLSKQSRRLRPRELSPLEHLQLETLGCLEPSGKENGKKMSSNCEVLAAWAVTLPDLVYTLSGQGRRNP